MSKLDAGQSHMLRLIVKGQDSHGWAKVSRTLWPHVSTLPSELVECRPADVGGHVRLTDAGKAVVEWM